MGAGDLARSGFRKSIRRGEAIPTAETRSNYSRIGGQSVERLAALSDGGFAFAMTVLLLDLRVPVLETVHSERDLWPGFVALSPRLVMYMMSFLTLGIFWVGQQTQLNHLERSNIRLSWTHLEFLSSPPSHHSQPRCWPSTRPFASP